MTTPTTAKQTPIELCGMLRRVTAKLPERFIAAGNVEDLALLVERRAALDDAITATARGLHAAGHSWTEIGRVLGMTRQSARERFGVTPAAGGAE